jgi:WD40 repeat protein
VATTSYEIRRVPEPVTVWEVSTGRPLLALRGHTGTVTCLAFSPDGRRLASGGGDWGRSGEVKVWDLTTSPEAHELPQKPAFGVV